MSALPRLMRITAAAAATVAAIALSTTPAHAASSTVYHGSIVFPTSEWDDPDICAAYGIVLHAKLDETLLWSFRIDGHGDFQGGFAHHELHFVLTANGKTVFDNDAYNNFFSPDGTSVATGLDVHAFSADGGKVLLEAGKVVYDWNGDPIVVRGPHPTITQNANACAAYL